MERTRIGPMVARWLGAGLAVVVVAGCGSAEPPAVDDEPSARDAFAEQVGLVVCERAEGCCVEAGRVEPGSSCTTDMRNDAVLALLEAEAEQRIVDEARFDECLDRLRASTTCDELRLAIELVDACPTLFSPIPEGVGEPGAACDGVFDCASPPVGARDCLQDVEDAVPVCKWLVEEEVGADCEGTPHVEHTCPTGFACRLDVDGTHRCLEAKGPHEGCVEETDCVEGYVCDQYGVCAPLPITQACDRFDGMCAEDRLDYVCG